MTYSFATITSPVGPLSLTATDNILTGLVFASDRAPLVAATGVLAQAAEELHYYFLNPSHAFTCAYKLQGSEFQHRVWQVLLTIPTGQTRTYGDIAKTLDTSPRSVGHACRCNPIALIVPCHRVVGARDIGGFMGKTTPLYVGKKEFLLHLEKASECEIA